MTFWQLAALAACIAAPLAADEDTVANPLSGGATWADLRGDIIGGAAPGDGSAVFGVDAPYRAHDAATVPVLIRQTDPSAVIETATVVIDENPAPVAAEFAFGQAMTPLNFEFRVRVNQYSNIRILAGTSRGLLMNGRFVKASGGCSAPASKNPELAIAAMGRMRLKLFDTPAAQISTPRREAQIMIRHPNYSGLQRDQVTQLFIPAHFIDTLEVRQGEDLLFTMQGGISISENPVFRFGYSDNGAPFLRVRATDTEGNVFEHELPKSGQI